MKRAYWSIAILFSVALLALVVFTQPVASTPPVDEAGLPRAQGGSCTTYTSSAFITIPDENATGITSTLVIPPISGMITYMRLSVRVNHPFPFDLNAYLTTANLCESEIFAEGQLSSVEYNGGLYFANDGLKYVDYDDFPYPYTYRPNANFSSNFRAGGRWTLHMVDSSGPDEGQLTGWSVTLCTGSARPTDGPATVTPTLTPTPTSTPTSTPTGTPPTATPRFTPVPTDECMQFWRRTDWQTGENYNFTYNCPDYPLSQSGGDITYESLGFLSARELSGSDVGFVPSGERPALQGCAAYDLTYLNFSGKSTRNSSVISFPTAYPLAWVALRGLVATATPPIRTGILVQSNGNGTLVDSCTLHDALNCWQPHSYEHEALLDSTFFTIYKERYPGNEPSTAFTAAMWGAHYCGSLSPASCGEAAAKPGYSEASIKVEIVGCENFTPTPTRPPYVDPTQTPHPPICGTPRPGGGWGIF